MRSALSPKNGNGVIIGHYRWIIVVGPIGESAVERFEKRENVVVSHRSDRRHKLDALGEACANLLDVMSTEAVHVLL